MKANTLVKPTPTPKSPRNVKKFEMMKETQVKAHIGNKTIKVQ